MDLGLELGVPSLRGGTGTFLVWGQRRDSSCNYLGSGAVRRGVLSGPQNKVPPPFTSPCTCTQVDSRVPGEAVLQLTRVLQCRPQYGDCQVELVIGPRPSWRLDVDPPVGPWASLPSAGETRRTSDMCSTLQSLPCTCLQHWRSLPSSTYIDQGWDIASKNLDIFQSLGNLKVHICMLLRFYFLCNL